MFESSPYQVEEGSVTAVVLAYNEALRFPYFLDHYRSLGISNFIVVDNNSDDGTDALLEAASDVLVLRTGKPYREHKSNWRQLICDRYLNGKWVIFPDVDELFVYPRWPEVKIHELTAYLDHYGYECMFSTMVDMYPNGPIQDLKYQAGDSFLETCPYFDGSGYRHVPLKGAGGREFNTPKRHVFGGARERLFHHRSKRKPHILDAILLSTVFRLQSKAPNSPLGRYFDRRLFKLIKDGLPGVDPLMSKVPLIKWRSGLTFSGGVHNIAQEIKMAPDWGALLHFKYLDDFSIKVTEALERGQHAVGSRFYKDYESHLATVMNVGAMSKSSIKFTGPQVLLECGLMRETSECRRYFDKATAD
ncbi:glycosyltransferase family 2 protein [Roseibium salinum]|uniref:Glycosyltransferase family 2 protein n=1 Tax=Roseibium salinum TaxID=1604349 RepID=A0ABT3R5I8_9HYPH|nr:glycosyltransferase family 2 protein [Roseibium sp. DSM 29163]MCX2724542.1 glycosyltransferase family 2 protein [Roseibium sp. DSM 29163]